VPREVDIAAPGAAGRVHIADAAIVAALGAAVFGFHLGSYRLWEPDEARYAEIAREMIALGNYLLPHLNYVLYVEKPPLLYWVTALSMGAFGHNELAARIPGALFAIAGALATWLFTAHTFDRRRALLAGAILATAPLYAVMAQVLTTDIALTALMTIALFALYLQWREGGRWHWIGYVAIGLGVLAKGPVAAAIPVLVFAVFLWRERALRGAMAQLHIVRGLIVSVAIAAPWFIYMIAKVPDFFSFYFIGEHLRRFLDSSYSHSAPLWFYIPVIAAGLLPWSVIAPFMVWRPVESNSARRFSVITALMIFAFFSISRSKLIPYIMPAIPPLAILIADAIARTAWPAQPMRLDRDDRSGNASSRLFVAAPILGLVGAAAIATAILGPHASSPYLMVIQPALLALGAVALIGGAMTAGAFRFAGVGAGLIAIVLTMTAALWTGTYGRLEAEPLRSYAALSQAVAERAPDATILCYRRYVQAIPFYTGRRAIVVGAKTELTFGAAHAPDAADWFFDGEPAMLRLWRKPGPVVIVLDERDLARLAPKLGPYVVIGIESHKIAILKSAVGGQERNDTQQRSGIQQLGATNDG